MTGSWRTSISRLSGSFLVAVAGIVAGVSLLYSIYLWFALPSPYGIILYVAEAFVLIWIVAYVEWEKR